MNFADFGMDTASLAGTLERKLAVIAGAGFRQVMIGAADVVAHPDGTAAGARAVRESGLRAIFRGQTTIEEVVRETVLDEEG